MPVTDGRTARTTDGSGHDGAVTGTWSEDSSRAMQTIMFLIGDAI